MTRRCQIIQNGGWPSRASNQIRKSPAGCAIPEYQISISPHLRVQSKMESKTESAHFYSRAFRFATHYPVRFRFYPRLSPFVPLGVGFQRRGPRPPAFVSLGVQGEVETPWCFSSGGVGRVLFQKRMRLTSLRWKPSLAGAENYVKARGDAARFPVIRNHDGCPSKFQALRKGK